jgi:hypothetical protein
MARRVAVHTMEFVPQQHPYQRGNKNEPGYSGDVMARTSDRMLLTVEEAASDSASGAAPCTTSSRPAASTPCASDDCAA